MIATRPCRATFKAKERPAIPLPRMRKSNCFMRTPRRSQTRVINQTRFSYKDRERHMRSTRDLLPRTQGERIKECYVIHASGGFALDQGAELSLELVCGMGT